MTSKHIHVLAIAGYAASGAALLAKQLGHLVTGSDEHAYPPVSDTLTEAGIVWANDYSPANLDRFGTPDLVVVSNTVRANNVELAAARERGLAIISEAEFFVELTGDRPRVAVCGTHGKSTTAALLAHMLDCCGLDPGFRLGAVALDFHASARLGTGPFVFEGDEYATAPWDSRPKFAHVHPLAACVTRVEHDHPDLYPSFADYRAPFVDLVRELPREGILALCADDPQALALREQSAAPVITYGENQSADWHIVPTDVGAAGLIDGVSHPLQHFTVHAQDGMRLSVALSFPGAHSRQNAAAALILAKFLNAPIDMCVSACASFRGPARRFEVVADIDGVTVVDDYGHHPTEVGVTVATARELHPERRIITVCIPHTYSRTRLFLDHYQRCFVGSDVVIIGPIEAARERYLPATVTSDDVAAQVRAAMGTSIDVRVATSAHQAVDIVTSLVSAGDVILCISLGGFDGFAERLAGALRSRHG